MRITRPWRASLAVIFSLLSLSALTTGCGGGSSSTSTRTLRFVVTEIPADGSSTRALKDAEGNEFSGTILVRNAAGDGVGFVEVQDSDGDRSTKAIFLRRGEERFTYLPDDDAAADDAGSEAYDINSQGNIIVGAQSYARKDASGYRSSSRAVVWRDGNMSLLPYLDNKHQYARADFINASGVIVGRSYDRFRVGDAFLYRDGRMQNASDLFGLPIDSLLRPNERGDLVGTQVGYGDDSHGDFPQEIYTYYIRVDGRSYSFEDLLPDEWKGKGIVPGPFDEKREMIGHIETVPIEDVRSTRRLRLTLTSESNRGL